MPSPLPDWLGSLLFGYRHVQSAGTPVNDSDTLNLSSAFSVAYNPATKVVDVGYSGGTVSNFLAPTGGSGTEGVDLGRFDAHPSNGALPGAFGVKDGAGTGYSLKVDNAGSAVFLNQNTTVTGTTTLDGDAEVTGALSVDTGIAVSGGATLDTATVQGTLSTVVIQGTAVTAQSAPGVGLSRVWFDQGSSLWKFINNGGSATAFATATDLAGYVPTTRTVAGTSGDVQVNGGTAAVALSSNLTLSLASTITGARTFSGSVTMSAALTLSSGLASALPLGSGGLGFTTATQGDLFYASAANTPAKLGVGGANTVLVGGGSVPAYSATPTVTSLTATTLTVNGRNVVGPSKRTMTTSGTALDGEIITADSTSAGFTITVPIGAATHVSIKRSVTDTSGHTITLSPASGTIEGAATITLPTPAGSSVEIWGDGTNAEVR